MEVNGTEYLVAMVPQEGYTTQYVCQVCGALVQRPTGMQMHADWHAGLNAVLAEFLVASKPAGRAA